jgi:3-dehydroquinate synthase
MKTITVDLGARSYPIHIGSGLLEQVAKLTPIDLTGRTAFILYDRNVESYLPKLSSALEAACARVESLAMDGGEETKSFDHFEQVLDWLLLRKVDRKSVLFVLGGGVIGDLGGFAASAILRGIPFVQIPTTLLSQVDSSVGGKTGINTKHGKNLVGAFYQPVAVLCDTDTLNTLPEREMKAGYAEVVKYGLLGDAAFYEWLEQNGSKVLERESNALTEAIERSCKSKANIVGDDEFEQAGGRRALLNLGHTFGHALEAAAGYDGRLLHGEGVSIGMVLAFRLCARMGLCSDQDTVRMEKHLSSLGLLTEISQIPNFKEPADELVKIMYHDKKASGGKISFVLVRGIGQAFQSADVDMSDVEAVISTSGAI